MTYAIKTKPVTHKSASELFDFAIRDLLADLNVTSDNFELPKLPPKLGAYSHEYFKVLTAMLYEWKHLSEDDNEDFS